MSRRERQFEDAWRHRAARPPATSPREAAGQVLQRLAEREQAARDHAARRRPLRLAAATALVVLALIAAAVLVRLPHAPSVPESAGEVAETALPPEGVVVLWLDAETPLYLTLEPPANGGADRKETMR